MDRLEPQGAQRGTTVAVELFGPRLGKAPQGLLWSRAGIEATKLEVVDDNRVRVELIVAADCPPGIHPLRVHTATGLSNLVQFHVGALAELSEVEPNDAPEAAQAIPLDTVVSGLVQGADVDRFAVELAEGERLSIEVEGLRLGRTMFDPAIAVLDPAGHEIAASDDAGPAYRDAFCSLLAPQAGRYLVLVRDAALQGDGRSSYRLHVGRFPRPAAVTPLGGRPGEKLAVRFLGDAAGELNAEIELPAAETEAFPVFAGDDRGTSPTQFQLRVVDLPNVLEVEPNGDREHATEAPPAAALEGAIAAAGDLDWYRVPLQKGRPVDVRMHARRLGSPVDGIVRVFDAAGRQLAANDDDRGEPDSSLRFAPPEDGDYFVRVEDRLNRGGPTFVYRVELSAPSPAVDLRIEEQQRYESQRVVVPRGNRAAIMVAASRRDVGGLLTIAPGELPAGISSPAMPLAADANLVPLVFEAAEDAPLGAQLWSLVATHAEEGKQTASFFKQQTWLVRGRNNFPMWNHWAERPPIAVVEPAPFKLRLVEPQAPLVQNGSKELRVVAERAAGFTAPIRLRSLYNPPGMAANNSLTIPAEQTEGTVPITAAGNARLGEFDVAIVGEADVDGLVSVSTQLAKLRIAPGYVGLAFAPVATMQGADAEYVVQVEQRTPFAGTAQAELLGLPPGVTAPNVEIDSQAERIVFPLTVAADARVGRHQQLACRVTIVEHGEPVVHTLGTGELRVDPGAPPGDAS
ncbi:MAG: PPC domain-containing protein [Pirellulales bacterium]|nr:PPC domain-containing protein [Pirellulales bacterium]